MLSNHRINFNYTQLDQPLQDNSNVQHSLTKQPNHDQSENTLQMDFAIIKFVIFAVIFDLIFFSIFSELI